MDYHQYLDLYKDHISGIVERVTHHADDSSCRLKVPSTPDFMTIQGRFPDIHLLGLIRNP